MVQVAVLDKEGKNVGEMAFSLPKKISKVAIKAAVVGFQAHQRQGNASTKTRAQVSGSGKKPWKQKGTGRARAGERGSPVWRGGGIAFGPKPHDYPYQVNKKVLDLAKDSALKIKFEEGKGIVVKDLKISEPKTKLARQVLNNLKINGKALVVVKEADSNMKMAFRNLSGVQLLRISDLNAYAIMTHQYLVFSSDALEVLNADLIKRSANLEKIEEVTSGKEEVKS